MGEPSPSASTLSSSEPATSVSGWACEECTAIMAKVSDFMKDPATIEAGIAFLQGDCFCGQDGHSADCADNIAQLIPPAMEVLAGVLLETTPELCQDVVGVC